MKPFLYHHNFLVMSVFSVNGSTSLLHPAIVSVISSYYTEPIFHHNDTMQKQITFILPNIINTGLNWSGFAFSNSIETYLIKFFEIMSQKFETFESFSTTTFNHSSLMFLDNLSLKFLFANFKNQTPYCLSTNSIVCKYRTYVA